jgi:hypothetical protein
VKDAKADAKKKSAWVKYDPAKVTPKELVDIINTYQLNGASVSRCGALLMKQRKQLDILVDLHSVYR